MDTPGEGLEAGHVADGRGPIVLSRLAVVVVGGGAARGGEDGVDVGVLQLLVPVDGVGVEQRGVLQGGE